MAAYNKFNAFVENLLISKIDFDADTFKIMLVNSPAPVATNSLKGDLTEISAGNGYSTGGATVTITHSRSGGVSKISASNDPVFTAQGGAIATFRYAVLYDDTVSSPAKPLIAWWDYSGTVNLNDTETFTVDFDAANGIFQLS